MRYTYTKLTKIFDLQDGWFDCWTAPSIQLDVTFLYHPIPLSGPPPQAEISTPEKESKLLSPLRVPTKSATRTSLKALIDSFDPAMMEADKCTVVLKVETSTAYLYGTLIRTFMHVKENLCGEDLVFTPMDVVTSSTAGKNAASFLKADCNHIVGFPIIFPNLNSNSSNVLNLRNLQEQV